MGWALQPTLYPNAFYDEVVSGHKTLEDIVDALKDHTIDRAYD